MTAQAKLKSVNVFGQEFDAVSAEQGHGLINIEAALNPGLVMDETIQRFVDANPENGGVVSGLNLPHLINYECNGTCTWLRTVTATEDGSWTAETDISEVSLDIKVNPSSFSLKKGESQVVTVTASVINSHSQSHDMEIAVVGNVSLVPDQAHLPTLNWPMEMQHKAVALPSDLNLSLNRDSGNYQLPRTRLGSISEFNSRVMEPVLANRTEIVLKQEAAWDKKALRDPEALSPESSFEYWLSVGSDATRVVAEIQERLSSTADFMGGEAYGKPQLFMGIDKNQDGVIQFDDEVICASISSTAENFCSINYPDAGDYWVLIHSPLMGVQGGATESFALLSGVVSNTETSDFWLEGPAVANSYQEYEMLFNWDFPTKDSEVYYSMLDIGSDAQNPGNIGFSALRLERDGNDVSVTPSQSVARPGDILDFEVKVAPNLSGMDRALSVQAQLSDGLYLIEESIQAPMALAENISVLDGTLSIDTEQLNSRDWERRYEMTTNENDPLCRVPNFGQSNAEQGTYIDFITDARIYPDIDGSWNPGPAGYSANPYIVLSDYFDKPLAMYGNFDARPALTVSFLGNGWLDLTGTNTHATVGPRHFALHQQRNFPLDLIALNWTGFYSEELDSSYDPGGDDGLIIMPMNDLIIGPPVTSSYHYAHYTPLDTFENTGITVLGLGDYLIVDYRGMTTAKLANSSTDPETGYSLWNWEKAFDDNYNAQALVRIGEYGYGDGEYEIVMAYNDIDFADAQPNGVVGVRGVHGYVGPYGPLDGEFRSTTYAYDNLNEQLKDDLVICYDYVGPESSQFTVKFKAAVLETAVGDTQSVTVNSEAANLESETTLVEVQVPSNIHVGEMANQQVMQGHTLEGLVVQFADFKNTNNSLTVTGDYISAEVVEVTHDQAVFNLTADADYTGETMVTVSIADKAHPSDKASVEFVLDILVDENKPAPAPEPEPEPEPEVEQPSSGGSLAWMSLFLLACCAIRRKALK
ncbi:GlyGly-CTERM sorting domain-containing protein [Paraferrimonas sedimenticola]